MNKALTVLSKVPWQKVLKYGGMTITGVASVWGAAKTDENTQKLIKKVAAKVMEKEMGSN